MRVYIRRMWINGQEVTEGGIGEVATHPAYRGRGLASQLMQDSEQWMRTHGIAISSLHASLGPVAAFYRKIGWRPVPISFARCALFLPVPPGLLAGILEAFELTQRSNGSSK